MSRLGDHDNWRDVDKFKPTSADKVSPYDSMGRAPDLYLGVAGLIPGLTNKNSKSICIKD